MNLYEYVFSINSEISVLFIGTVQVLLQCRFGIPRLLRPLCQLQLVQQSAFLPPEKTPYCSLWQCAHWFPQRMAVIIVNYYLHRYLLSQVQIFETQFTETQSVISPHCTVLIYT